MSRFTATHKINSRWRNNDFVGEAGSSHTFPDAFHEEFLEDWAFQIANGDIIITETPTTGNIQMASLTVGNIVLTGSATGNFGDTGGGTTVIGTSPISVATSGSTATVSLNASYQTAGSYATASHLHDADYVNVGGDTMSGQLLVSSATTTTTVGFGEIVVAKGTSYGSITVNAADDHIHIRSKNPIEILAQSSSTMQGIRARGLGVNSTHTYPTLIDDGITFGEDANLYRVSANALKTDDALEVVGSLTNGGTSVSLSTHTHAYQPSGTYVTSIAGTAPIVASTTTAGAATVSVSTGTTSVTVALGNHGHIDFATLTGTETLTNKTLTAPKLNRALIGTSTKTDATGVLTLTNTSDYIQNITGSTTSILMPDATTLPLNAVFTINNLSGSSVNLITSDGISTIAVLQSGHAISMTAKDITVNTTAAWQYLYSGNNGVSGTGALVLQTSPSLISASLSGLTTTTGGFRWATSSITSAGTTTTLTNTGSYNQRVTGTSAQTIKLPSSYTIGHSFQIHNESTGIVTVTASDNSVLTTLVTGQMLIVVGNTTNGTTQASWNRYAVQASNEGILLASTALTITTVTQPATPTTANTQLISWTSATKANTDMWSSGGSITLPNAGLYSYSFGSRFGSGATYNVGAYAFQGSTLVHHITKDASSLGSLDNIEMNGFISAAAGDTFSIRVAATAASKSLSANTFLGVSWQGNH